MKPSHISLLVVGILAAHLTAAAQNPGDNVLSGIQIHTINIRFAQPNYWDSLTTYYTQGLEQYMAAAVVVDGMTYDSVGVRLKGNSSYTHPNNKKSFRFAFDQYKSLKWDGLKSIHLNNCWEDPTFMREKIHLDFCRDAGIPAPRAAFAQLSLNDTLFAFYSMVEHVDKKFLGSHYGNTTGDLFKAVDGFSADAGILSDFRWLGSDTSLYLARYELKTDESVSGWRKLVTFIDTLNNSASPAASLPGMINLDALYHAIATDNLFANLDSYIGSSRNFYAYFQPATSMMDWIIWDVGLSFGGFPSGGVSNVESMSITYVNNATQRPLFAKVLMTPAFKTTYLHALCALHSTYFTQAHLFPHIDSVANAIRPYVYADSRKMYTNQQFETNISSDLTVGSGRKPGLKSFVTQRQASVLSQLTALGVSCGTDTTVTEPTLTAILLPRIIEGINGTNANRIPYAYRARLTGLLSKSTYRFTNQIVTSSDAATTSGSGNCIFTSGTGDFVRTSSPSLAAAGGYGSFTTDSTGSYTGWFITEPTGNTRFVPGKYVFMRIALNDGSSGTTAATRLTTADSVRVVKLDPAVSDSTGTGLRCTSAASPKDLVFLYDNIAGTGRPVTGSFVESDGTDNSTANSYASFYATWVNGASGAFGVALPNTLANGILRVEQRALDGGGIRAVATDPDGVWPSGANTVNPSGGTTPIVLVDTDVALATAIRLPEEFPTAYGLSQNYPNPFNPVTTIGFRVSGEKNGSGGSGLGSSWVRLSVYDILGREVGVLVNERKEPGSYAVTFTANGLASGVYFYRMTAGAFVQTERMLLVR